MSDDFLNHTGWENAAHAPTSEDGSARRYFRLSKDGKTTVLMDSRQDNSLPDFIRIGDYLRSTGLKTPEIYKADLENGYLLLEDFGDTSFRKALCNQDNKTKLYELATDVLSHMRKSIIDLPDYYDSTVHEGHRRVIDWYLPAVRGEQNTDGQVEEYLNIWAEIEQSLPPCPQGFLHIDYHVENLMWLPQNEGLAQCGILDFQGAMRGPVPYDLANLLEDARIDTDKELRRAMLDRFCVEMTPEDKEAFENWYRVLATQFHCRVAGQFIKLALKDNKERYLEYLPRVTNYLKEGLEHPVLQPLQKWFNEQGLNFNEAPIISAAKTNPLIRVDAF